MDYTYEESLERQPRMQTYQELESLKHAYKLAGLGYWSIELETEQLYWSDEVFYIHGLDPETYIPALDNTADLYHPHDKEKASTLLQKAMAHGEAFEYELRIVRTDGSTRYVRSKAECFYDDGGRAVSIFGIFQDIDDEVKEKHRVEIAEIAHKTHIDGSGDGYWDWHIQDDYEYMSPRFWEILGYLPEEKPHSPSAWQDLIFEDDLNVALDNFNKHINSKGQHPYEQEVRYRHKNGSTVTVLCRGKVIEWDDNGNALRMVGTHTDITYLKAIEKELRQSREQYDLAVTGSSVGLWDWNIAQDTLYWSDRFKEIIGIRDVLHTASFAEFEQRLHPEDRPIILEAVENHITHKEPYDVEYRLQHDDGHYVWIHARGQAIWNRRGKPTRMAGSIDDITIQKNSEIILEKALDFQKLLMKVNTDLIFVKDEKHRIVEANESFIGLYPEEQRDKVIGYTTVEDYDPDEAEAFLAEDKKAFREGLSEVVETILFPDKTQRTLLTKKIRFEGFNHEEFIFCIARDITQLKKIEDELLKANGELEEFAYRTSHDLRSPLISSKKLLDIIRENIEQGDIDTSLSYLDIVIDSLRKLEELVSDILKITKLNNSELELTSVDIKALIDDSLQKFSHMDGYEDIHFYCQYDYDKPLILQKEHLILVIENLLSNAIKYRDGSKSESFVKVETERNGNQVSVKFTDNGLGIPEKSRRKLFTMFKRFHPNTAFGSGLGLYMVKKSLDKMGGDIEYNDVEQGTQFVVTLPLSD
ncbi:PAS domain S-box protein [Alteromonadaceae bacterium M269]|nr:PAS domain S-box protein [Alteromonadaceae bacterium M269]